MFAALALLGLGISGGALAADSPVVEGAPNIWGQTGVVRTTDAAVHGNGVFDLSADGFLSYQSPFLLGKDDNVLAGGNVALSAELLDLLELSLASRAGSDVDNKAAAAQFSVGDVFFSLKGGYPIGPLAIGADVRTQLPTAVNSGGFDFTNLAVTSQLLVSLDLHRSNDIPLRAHLNGGFVFQQGNQNDAVKKFEDNPNFYSGVDGQLTALAADQWFYHQAIAGLGVEVPLPYVTPFLETWYQASLQVGDGRGSIANKGVYDFVNDAHLTVTPGARVTLGGGITFDVAVDIGVLGTADGGTDATKIVNGQPLNPLYAVRGGLTYTFDPFSSGGGGGGAVTSASAGGQVKGCVTDDGGNPIPGAVVSSEALSGARIATDEVGCFLTPILPPGDVQLTVEKPGFEKMTVAASIEKNKIGETTAKLKSTGAPVVLNKGGIAHVSGYITNREDETVDAELELWDAGGMKAAGKAVDGAFDLQAQAGSIVVVAKADGYLAQGAAVVVEPGGKGRVSIVLKKTGKVRKAALTPEKIAVTAKVPFEFKKPRLQSAAEYLLDDVVDTLLRNPNIKVRIDDYAESLGSPEESQKLADERAAAVAHYLIEHGVWPARLSTKGIAAAENRDRRVDFIVVP